MPEPLAPVTLAGRHVRLEPLASSHVPGLARAAAIDRATYEFTWVPNGPQETADYVTALRDAQSRAEVLPFAQCHASTGDPVGCTRLMEPRWWRGRAEADEIEIGGTWLAAPAQRTAINTEAKLLLLRHAFEAMGVWRVAICTDARNTRSRIAVERLGATFEGVLRHHRPRHDAPAPAPRDSAMYSIIDEEWPAIADGLRRRLEGAHG